MPNEVGLATRTQTKIWQDSANPGQAVNETTFNASATGARMLQNNARWIERQYVTFSHYGGKDDNFNTDSAATFEAALAHCHDNDVDLCIDGGFLIDAPVSLVLGANNVRIFGGFPGSTLKFGTGLVSVGAAGLTISPAYPSALSVLANVSRGTATIATTTAHGAAVGDICVIIGNEIPESGWNYKTTHTSIIQDVPNTTTVELVDDFLFDFKAGDSIYIIPKTGRVTVEDLIFDTTLVPAIQHRAMIVAATLETAIRRCKFVGLNPSGQCDAISISDTVNMRIEDCHTDGWRYAFLMNRHRNMYGFRNRIDNGRHAFTPASWGTGLFVDGMWGNATTLIDGHPSFFNYFRNVYNLNADTTGEGVLNCRSIGFGLENVWYSSTKHSDAVMRFCTIQMDAGPYPSLALEHDCYFRNCNFNVSGGQIRIANCRTLYTDGLDVNGASVEIGSSVASEKVLDWDRKGIINGVGVSGEPQPRIYWPQKAKLTQPRYSHIPTRNQYTGTADASSTGTVLVTDSDFGTADGDLVGYLVEITGGTGAGQESYCTNWVASTKSATIAGTFSPAPDGTSQFRIHRYTVDVDYAPDWEVVNRWGKARMQLWGADTSDGETSRSRRVRIYPGQGQPFATSNPRYSAGLIDLFHLYQTGAGIPQFDVWRFMFAHKNVATASIQGPQPVSRIMLDPGLNKLYSLDVEDVVIDMSGSSDWLEFTVVFGSEVTNHAMWANLDMFGVGIES